MADRSKYQKEWYEKNKQDHLTKANNYYAENREEILDKVRIFRENNPDKVKASNDKYLSNPENILKKNIKSKERLENNPAIKLKHTQFTRIRQILNINNTTNSFIKSLGCTSEELKNHIESKWEKGMSWENRNKGGWGISHNIPLTEFDLSDPNEVEKALHFTNLKPVWLNLK